MSARRSGPRSRMPTKRARSGATSRPTPRCRRCLIRSWPTSSPRRSPGCSRPPAEDALGPLYALAVSTGLRRGELVGLRWSDVKEGALSVQRSVARDDAGGWSASDTKSRRSRRTLPLPAIARNALDRQRKRQAAAKLAAGTAWQDRAGLVFTDAVGRPLLPEYVSHAFATARTAAGLPTATLHQLRHTAATFLLARRRPLVVISEWLGHRASA